MSDRRRRGGNRTLNLVIISSSCGRSSITGLHTIGDCTISKLRGESVWSDGHHQLIRCCEICNILSTFTRAEWRSTPADHWHYHSHVDTNAHSAQEKHISAIGSRVSCKRQSNRFLMNTRTLASNRNVQFPNYIAAAV